MPSPRVHHDKSLRRYPHHPFSLIMHQLAILRRGNTYTVSQSFQCFHQGVTPSTRTATENLLRHWSIRRVGAFPPHPNNRPSRQSAKRSSSSTVRSEGHSEVPVFTHGAEVQIVPPDNKALLLDGHTNCHSSSLPLPESIRQLLLHDRRAALHRAPPSLR